MKKVLLSALAATALCLPVLAEDKVKSWNSLDSVGCMMLRECTEGVDQISSWNDLGIEYALWAEELDAIISSLKAVNIGIYLADEKYFLRNMRGVYDVTGNNMYINRFYLEQPTKLVQVIRHEGWHAAQDCMAGTLDNTFTALIHPEESVPDWIRSGAERTYPKKAVPWEAEAMWAMYSENRTKEALEACSGPAKMWQVFEPTPLTGEWLKKKGFMN